MLLTFLPSEEHQAGWAGWVDGEELRSTDIAGIGRRLLGSTSYGSARRSSPAGGKASVGGNACGPEGHPAAPLGLLLASCPAPSFLVLLRLSPQPESVSPSSLTPGEEQPGLWSRRKLLSLLSLECLGSNRPVGSLAGQAPDFILRPVPRCPETASTLRSG